MKSSKRRHFYMPNGKSSCCNSTVATDLRHRYCRDCGGEIHVISNHPKYATIFTDLEGIFVNDNKYGKRVRQVKYTSKYFVAKHGKIVRLESMNSFTYNWATGRLYNVIIHKPNRKMVRDITYKAQSFVLEKKFIKRVVQMRAFYLLPEIDIIRDIEQSLEVNDLFAHIDVVYNKTNYGDFMAADNLIRHILFCLAYPKFSWMKCPVHAAPTAKFRKALKTATNNKTLYRAFFHNNVGKSTIEFLHNDDIGQTKSAWWVIRFMSMFLNKDKLWHFINSGGIVSLIDENERAFDETCEFIDLTQKAVNGFVNDYGIDRFLNQIEDFCCQKYMSPAGVRMMLKDSVKMWKDIKDQTPEYTLPRSNSFKEYHDNLARDVRKLSIDNEEIKYTKNELNLNSTYGNVEFKLPLDTHTIMDYGDYLRICVGGAGYTKEAVKKKMIILFGVMNGTPVVCMQIQKNRLVQAKLMCNNLASSDLNIRSAIVDLCFENGITHDDCYDIKVREEWKPEWLQPEQAAQPQVFVAPGNDNFFELF